MVVSWLGHQTRENVVEALTCSQFHCYVMTLSKLFSHQGVNSTGIVKLHDISSTLHRTVNQLAVTHVIFNIIISTHARNY